MVTCEADNNSYGNTSQPNQVIYLHWTRADGQSRIFYVGRGVGRRPWHRCGRSNAWHQAIALYGYYRVLVVHKGLDKETAKAKERELIERFSRQGEPLVNRHHCITQT